MRMVSVRLGSRSYRIHIGSGILSQAGQWLRDLAGERLVIITSPVVRGLYGDVLAENLTRDGFRVDTLLVPDGEEHKSLETAGRLYQELADIHAERKTPVLALGGGVIGDLAGFVAATYQRGVPLVQVPTTLLAQVDSSIGGKVALDHGRLKNKIGAFYQPRLVVSDTATLATLPEAEVTGGLAEVIKYAVIRGKGFFTYLENNLDRVRTLDSKVIEEVVFRSVRVKAMIIEKDERDFGLRNLLNYGHTIGHAVESVSDFKIGHGPAVAIGMIAAGRIAVSLGMFSRSEQSRLVKLIRRAGLPVEMPDLAVDRLIQAMEHDKKIVNGRIRFILPRTIGRVIISDEVTPSLVEQALAGGYDET